MSLDIKYDDDNNKPLGGRSGFLKMDNIVTERDGSNSGSIYAAGLTPYKRYNKRSRSMVDFKRKHVDDIL